MLKTLSNHKYKSITTRPPYFSAVFATPKSLVYEGTFYRLSELHIIPTNGVLDVVEDENKIVVKYKNGKEIELEIAKEPK